MDKVTPSKPPAPNGTGGITSAVPMSILTPPMVTPKNRRAEEDDPKKPKIPWSPEEDEVLREAVDRFKGRSWKQVAELLPGRTHSQAAHRWQKVLDPKLKKGSWTKEEDDMLQSAVEELGEGHWSRVAERVGSRNGKQCRERWRNQISPDVDKRPWSEEEDRAIVRLYGELGPKWAEIAKQFPGRTENAVKNRWNAKLGRAPGSASPASPAGSRRGRASAANGTPRTATPSSSKKASAQSNGMASIAAAAALAGHAASSKNSISSSSSSSIATGKSMFAPPTPLTPAAPVALAPSVIPLVGSSPLFKSDLIFSTSTSSAFSNRTNGGLVGLTTALNGNGHLNGNSSSPSKNSNSHLPPLPPKKKLKGVEDQGVELLLSLSASPGTAANRVRS